MKTKPPLGDATELEMSIGTRWTKVKLTQKGITRREGRNKGGERLIECTL